MSLGAFLGMAAGPIAKRVLAALGVGVVSFVGVGIAFNALVDIARTNWGGLPADIAQYMAFAGVNQAISIIVGAMAARLALASLKSMTLL